MTNGTPAHPQGDPLIFFPCPACALRWVGGVSPEDCPVCAGEARLPINPVVARDLGQEGHENPDSLLKGRDFTGDLVERGARVVSAGVWLGLARAARDARGSGQGARVLGERVSHWWDSNVLGVGGNKHRKCMCLLPMPGDGVLLAGLCAAHERQPGERARLGALPRLSAGGHPSDLALLVDPVDLDSTPGKRFMVRERTWRQASRLELAVEEVASDWVTMAPGGAVTNEVAA